MDEELIEKNITIVISQAQEKRFDKLVEDFGKFSLENHSKIPDDKMGLLWLVLEIHSYKPLKKTTIKKRKNDKQITTNSTKM